jgi:tRNA (guanine-N7-)-methyltransferase
MGHDKLRKFAENETFSCLLQPEASSVLDKVEGSNSLILREHPIKGHWNERMFAAAQPIVLELGCGKGEYTIDLSRREPSLNYIGVDIKGARLWKGAKFATENKLPNVAFLRTRIEFIEAFFAPEEVSEIWLTFSDPQMKSENCRLTSPLFLERYRKFLKNDGIVHLKTDSNFMFTYTRYMIERNRLPVDVMTEDLYHSGMADEILSIKTYYEQQWLDRGLNIKYIKFHLPQEGELQEPDVEIELDEYRSYNRSKRSGLQTSK